MDEVKPWLQMELEFRRGQMRSSLDGVRTHLFVRYRLNTQRTLHVRHQHASTRARQVLARNDLKIKGLTAKYRAAWGAARIIANDEAFIGFQPLHDRDLRSLEDVDGHATKNHRKAVKRRADGSEVGSAPIQPGESRKTLSWIWTGVDTSEDSEAMKEATRVEWTKAWARKRRWDEELQLLEEEMRRTVESMKYEARQWREYEGDAPTEDTTAVSEGQTAYSLRQASIREALAAKFTALWALPDPKPRTRKVPILAGFGADSDGDDNDDNEGENIS